MFTVTLLGKTNYSEIPTGEIEGDVNEFVARNALNVLFRTTTSLNVRAEWGNGDGCDRFLIEFDAVPVPSDTEAWCEDYEPLQPVTLEALRNRATGDATIVDRWVNETVAQSKRLNAEWRYSLTFDSSGHLARYQGEFYERLTPVELLAVTEAEYQAFRIKSAADYPLEAHHLPESVMWFHAAAREGYAPSVVND